MTSGRAITAHTAAAQRSSRLQLIIKNYQIYLMLLPCLLYFAIFCYGPMYGVQIAFKDYNTGIGIWNSPWVGLKHFRRFMSMPQFWQVFKNTLLLSLYSLIAGFPFPILISLMINEISRHRFKKVIQTVTYAPHFISTVVMVAMISLFLSPTSGFINKFIEALGGEAINFMIKPAYFPHIYVWTGIWQHFGWNSIIYLAALASVDEALHESAVLDGASRLQRIWYINLPCMAPTIVIQLILSLGGILGADFEKVLLMQNASIMETADIIGTYTYRIGILGSEFSLSSAIGILNSVINLIMLVLVNGICRRISDTSLW
ncbi:MAG: sugar ABC transporter permease [Provencibacterium sp.]|jgi:putative aldouronate transport system permease protein|nr:sugar ABC transporter permease [Provencibacterium sp.]